MKPEIQKPYDSSTQMSSPGNSTEIPSELLDSNTNPGSSSEVTLDGQSAMSSGTMSGTMPGTGEFPAVDLASPRRMSRTDADMDLEYQAGEAFGRYQLVRKIAAGGMGVVYEARDQELHRSVALKMILLGRNSNPDIIERFYREARSAAKLDHPNIVPIYEINAVGGQHYFTMAMIAGRSFQAEIEKGGRMQPARAISLMTSVAEAVGYAHQHHIIHRDLKPDNILLDISGRPRVTDFGLAKSLQENSNLTQTGQVMGTPRYMSPEQARAGEACIGPSTDIYALGGILVYLLTGKPPFDGTSLTEVLCKVMAETPLLPRDMDETISPQLHEICRRCLAKKPEDRYATCEDLIAALATTGSVPTSVGFATFSSDSDLRAPMPSPSVMGVNETLFPSKSAAVVEFPEPKSRGMLNAALIGVAVLALVAVGALVLTMGKSPVPVVKQDDVKPRVAIDDNGVTLKGFDLAKVPVYPSATLVNDFKLDFKVLGNAEVRDEVRLFNDEESVRFEVKAEKDIYLGVWTVDDLGVVVQLFPNLDEPDNLIRAGEVRTVPSQAAKRPYSIRLARSNGIEQLRITASTKPWTELKTTREGAFLVYRDPAVRKEVDVKTRGFYIKRESVEDKNGDTALVAEQYMNYFVKPSVK